MLSEPPQGSKHAFVCVEQDLADKLRPHQREGVKFIWEACMGRRGSLGHGCILADDMGLGKTLQTIATIWTMMRSSPAGVLTPEIKIAMVLCPTSLVMNWAKEVKQWLGEHRMTTMVITSSMSKQLQREKLASLQTPTSYGRLLICSYGALPSRGCHL